MHVHREIQTFSSFDPYKKKCAFKIPRHNLNSLCLRTYRGLFHTFYENICMSTGIWFKEAESHHGRQCCNSTVTNCAEGTKPIMEPLFACTFCPRNYPKKMCVHMDTQFTTKYRNTGRQIHCVTSFFFYHHSVFYRTKKISEPSNL